MRSVVQGLPVLCTLRREFPGAWIAGLAEEPFAEVLQGHDALDHFIGIPRNLLRSPRAFLRLLQEVRREEFDVAIDLQGPAGSAIIALLSGAGSRIGFGGDHAGRLGRWLHTDRVSVRARHVVEHYLALLRPLDIFDPPVEFGLSPWQRAGEAVDRFLCRAELLPGGFAIMDAAAEHPSHPWPADRYASVARYLGGRYGLPTVAVWRATADREAAETILHGSGGWGVLAPAMSLRGSAELARRAAFLVGSDTGLMHLAVAVGTPTISLHGTTHSSWSGAYGATNVRLQAFEGNVEGRAPRAADRRAIQSISVETVCAACSRLLLSDQPARAQRLAA